MRQNAIDRLQNMLAVVIVVGSGALLAATLAMSRVDTMAAQTTLTHSVVAVVAEQSARTIQNVDQKLQFIAAQLGHRLQEGRLAGPATDALLRGHLAALPFVSALCVLDVDGRVVADSASGRLGLDYSGRDYSAAFRQQPSRGFYLGAPRRSSATGNWLIGAAYPLRSADGALVGVVVAALEPPYFEKLWHSIDFGSTGQIDLYRADGVLMASSASSNALIGQQPGERSLALALARGAASTSRDGNTLLVSQPLGMYPQMTLTARRSLDELLRQWRHYALVMGGAWLLLSTLVVSLFVMRRRAWMQKGAVIEALERSERKFAAAFRASPDAIMITRATDGVFVEISDSVTRITGYTRADLVGHSSLERELWVEPQARQRYIATIAAHGRVTHMEAQFRMRSGEERTGDMSGEVIEVDGQAHVLGIIRDVTEHRRREDLIWQQAHYDALTGLANRRMLADRLATRIAAGQGFALLLIDLDQFKEVNDTLGHEQGDQLLVQVASRIGVAVATSASALVARLGGDEFAIILPAEDSDSADSAATDATDATLARLLEALSSAFTLGQDRVFISASIGVARYPDAGAAVDELLRHADQAMYAAKHAGRNRYCHFHPSLQEAAGQRAALTNGLRDALAGEQFVLQFQPIFELASGRLHKAEALVRWQRPQGTVAPADFIALAESSGLIREIGDWVFRQAVADACRLRSIDGVGLSLSVNVSPVQFFNDGALAARWLAHLAAAHLPASAITIEITEGLLLDLTGDVRDTLRAFSDAGVCIALDDFGTGYSSLSYLRKFAIDFLKIDRAFVRHIEHDAGDLALCEAIVAMAHRLGLQVVVEGIETAGQLALMRAADCDHAQGYYLGRPMNIDQLEQLMRAAPRALD